MKKERLRHIQAFETYYALGDDRSFTQLGLKISVHRRTIQLWSVSFEWDKRIETRDDKIAIRLRQATDRSILEQRIIYLDIIRTQIDKFMLDHNNLDIVTVADFRELVKLDLLLSGSPTDIVKIDLNLWEQRIIGLPPEGRQALRQHILEGKSVTGFDFTAFVIEKATIIDVD